MARPALAALAEQQSQIQRQASLINAQRQQIDAQALRLSRLERNLRAIARQIQATILCKTCGHAAAGHTFAPGAEKQSCETCGCTNYEKDRSTDTTSSRRRADVLNPAQPIEDPPAEAPAATTEETLGDLNADDVLAVGGTSETDVAPDATTDVTAPGGTVLDEPLDLNEQDVTAPVAGTEEVRPLTETKVETDVRIGDPGNTDTFAPIEPFMAPQTTAGRTFASLRLAKLQIAAGIAEGDEMDVAASIDNSNKPDALIQNEIETLSKIQNTAKGRPVTASRGALPRQASTTRSMPSIVASTAPMTATASASNDDEALFE